MNLKPKKTAEYRAEPTAFRDFKNIEWKVGNAVIDTSGMNAGDTVEPFTAIHLNADTGLYELVGAETPETMNGALLTGGARVTVEEPGVNEMVSGVRKGAMIESRCHGVTDNFKAATQGRLTFDV